MNGNEDVLMYMKLEENWEGGRVVHPKIYTLCISFDLKPEHRKKDRKEGREVNQSNQIK